MGAIVLNRDRSFRTHALSSVSLLKPDLQIYGREHIPAHTPYLVMANHYSRPGFQAWWLALAVSACLPCEVHWIITAAWTYPDRFRSIFLTSLTYWLFHKVANVYGFTTMPPMPPDPGQVFQRARAVRNVLEFTRSTQSAVIGLLPEGRDIENENLGHPPAGVGRFIGLICESGYPILPVGVFEESLRLCLRFGPLFSLPTPTKLSKDEFDSFVINLAMNKISELLPVRIQRSQEEWMR